MQLFKSVLSEWAILKEISNILSVPYDATISLQKKSLTLSDVYGIWLQMKLHLRACQRKKNFCTGLANHLLNALRDREGELFDPPVMSAALFLDPRFRSQIIQDSDKMQQAKTTLKNIWRKLLTLSSEPPAEETNSESVPTESSEDSFSDFDATVEMDKFLGCGETSDVVVSSVNTNEVDIENLLDEFNPTIIKSNQNVLEWWEKNKSHHPDLYKLAMVVLAMPPTEVQIERDFSKLNFVFSNRRCKISHERLEDIMIISLNDEVFYSVKQDEMDELMSNID